MFGAKTIFRAKTFPPAWTTHNVLLGTQEMSCLEHKECPASNTRNVLLRTQGMSCFDHKECSVSNTKNFLLGTHGMFCFEHTECPSSNIRNFVRRTQGLSFLEHKERPSSNTKNVLLRTQGVSSSNTRSVLFEHKEYLSSRSILFRLFVKLRMMRQTAGSSSGRSGWWHFCSKLRTAVYLTNKARIGKKLRQNTFQTICNFSFFDAENNNSDRYFFTKFPGSIFFSRNWRFGGARIFWSTLAAAS